MPPRPKDTFLLFSDLHFVKSSKDTCLEVLYGILDYALENDINEILFCGDWYMIRYQVDIELQNLTQAWLDKTRAHNIRVVFLAGNHDMINYSSGENALSVFQDLPSVEVVDKFYSIYLAGHTFGCIPYRKDNERLIEEINAVKGKVDYLIGHFGVFGSYQNDTIQDLDGIPPAVFSEFKRVFLGHYHKRQAFYDNKIIYIGSPYQVSLSEAGQPKGFALFTPRTNHFEFVDRDWGAKFHRVEGNQVDFSRVKPGDRVHIKINEGESIPEAPEWVKLTTTVVPKEQKARLDFDSSSSIHAGIKVWFETHLKGTLDFDTFLSAINKLLGVTK